MLTLVLQRDIKAGSLPLYPFPVLVDVRGIDDEEEAAGILFIHQQVVHDTTVLIAHHAIEDFAVSHASHVIGEDMVDETPGIGATHQHLTHVADIKDPTMLAHRLMLVHDIRILYRHVETAEGGDERPQCYVFVI